MSTPNSAPPFPRKAFVTAGFVGLLGIAGNLSSGIYPVFVASMIAVGRASASQLGILATAEFLPFGAATLLAGRFLPDRQLRLTAGICLVVQIFMAYATTKLSFSALVPCRALFGIASGILIRIVYAYAARWSHPGRLVAIYTTALMIVGVLWSWIGPSLVMPAFGPAGVIMCMSIPSLLALVLVAVGPNDLPPLLEITDQDGNAGKKRLPRASLFVLFSVGLWSAYMTIFWVYSEPLAALHTGSLVQHWLTVSLVCQILGSAFAALFAERLPYRTTVSFGLIISIAQVSLILWGVGSTGFLAWTAIYGFLGWFLVPFFVRALIETDPSRRSVVYYPAAQNLAGSLGPLLVSQFVSDSDLRSGLIIDLGAIVAAPALFWLALAAHSRLHRTNTKLPIAISDRAGPTESRSRSG